MARRRPGPALVAAGLAALALFPAAGAPPARGRVHKVVIRDMKFGPLPPAVAAGDTIIWVNRDLFRHSATASDRSFDVDLPPGKSAATRLARAGTVTFLCKYHPGMKGRLRVGR